MRFGLLFLLILVLSTSSFGQGNLEWTEDGRSRNTDPILTTAFPLDTLSITRAALEFYARQGHFNAHIDSLVSDSLAWHLYTNKGSPYRLNELYVHQDSALIYQEDIQLPRFRPGNYSAAALENFIERYLQAYEAEGYILARVAIDSLLINHEKRTLSAHLSVNPQKKLRSAGIITPDLEHVGQAYIKRASGLRDSSIITPRSLLGVKQNLENTEFFRQVNLPDVYLKDENSAYVGLNVEQQNPNNFDLLVGYVPNPDGGGEFVGSGKVRLRNLFAQGSTLDLNFDRLQAEVTKFNLEYKVNWISGIPLSATFGMNFIQEDTLYQVRNFFLRPSYALSANTRLLFGIRRETSVGNANARQNARVLDARITFFGVGLEYGDLDDPRVPLRGFRGILFVESGQKQITDERLQDFGGAKKFRQNEAHIDLWGYFSPFRRQVIAPSLHGFFMDSPEFTESDLNRFGGAQSLRGYQEDQFFASEMLWGDLEYRYLLDRYTYAFLFGALGYFNRPSLVTEAQTPDRADWLNSYGLGFAFQTQLGMLKFTYAIGEDNEFSNGTVHFGIQGRL